MGGSELSASIVTDAKLESGGYTPEGLRTFKGWRPKP